MTTVERSDIIHYFQEAAFHIANKEYDKAIGTLQGFLCVAPREPLAYQFLGDLYLHMKTPEKAVKPLKHAIKLAPKEFLSYQLLAETYASLGKEVSAKNLLKKASQYRPNTPSHA
jgi:tetratricopeptide (TPR) repeat protein